MCALSLVSHEFNLQASDTKRKRIEGTSNPYRLRERRYVASKVILSPSGLYKVIGIILFLIFSRTLDSNSP